MKNKFVLAIVTVCAIATLSFSFVSNKEFKVQSHVEPVNAAQLDGAPIGGFAMGDQLEK